MQRSLIIGLLAALILTVFALQNDAMVSIHFFLGEPVEGSLSLILLITVIIGVILGIIFSVPSINKQSKIIQQKKKEIDKLEGILEGYRKEAGRTKEQDEKEKPKDKKKK
ncbi:MAG: lipopolysaccharide assembly protein LapA domain-containing protein [Bacteroidota bacterium]